MSCNFFTFRFRRYGIKSLSESLEYEVQQRTRRINRKKSEKLRNQPKLNSLLQSNNSTTNVESPLGSITSFEQSGKNLFHFIIKVIWFVSKIIQQWRLNIPYQNNFVVFRLGIVRVCSYSFIGWSRCSITSILNKKWRLFTTSCHGLSVNSFNTADSKLFAYAS